MNTAFTFISPLTLMFGTYIFHGIRLVKEGELALFWGCLVLIVSLLPLMLHPLIINLEKELIFKIGLELAIGFLLLLPLYVFR